MSKMNSIYNDYCLIHKLKSACEVLGINDLVFSCLALAYSLGLYSEKYDIFAHCEDFIDFIFCKTDITDYGGEEYAKQLDYFLKKQYVDPKITTIFKRIFDLGKELDKIHINYSNNLDGYTEIKDRMIKKIMSFDKEIDENTATKIFNLYYALYLGSLLNMGDTKISDRAISNILLSKSTRREYDSLFDKSIYEPNIYKDSSLYSKNEYARFAISNYFMIACDRLKKVRNGSGKILLYDIIDAHRSSIDMDSIKSSIITSKSDGLKRLILAHDGLDYIFNKKRLGYRISENGTINNDSFYNCNYLFPDIMGEFFNIHLDSGKNNTNSNIRRKIDNHLISFLNNNIFKSNKIDGAYTIRFSDNNYKLFIVAKNRDTYNSLLENLEYLSSCLHELGDDLKDFSFTITPLYIPSLQDDSICSELFKESILCGIDTIYYDRTKALSNKINSLIKQEETTKQYIRKKGNSSE